MFAQSAFLLTGLTIAKKWKQPRRPLTDKWINKTWNKHKTGYYSVSKGGNCHLL